MSQYALYTSLINSTFVSGLTGRESGDDALFQGIADLVNDYLGLSVSSGLLDLQTSNSFLSEVDGLVGNALSAIRANGGPGLDTDSINNVLQEIETNAGIEFSDAVKAGNLNQEVVNFMLTDLDNFIGEALQEGDSGLVARDGMVYFVIPGSTSLITW